MQVRPFVVLTSVLFGSTLFGVLGALLAIPVAAAIQISIIEYNASAAPENIGAVQAPPPATTRAADRAAARLARSRQRRDAGLGEGDRGVEDRVDLLSAQRARRRCSMRSAAVSSATPSAAISEAAASRAASRRSGPSSRSSASRDDLLDDAEELRAAGADGRDLAARAAAGASRSGSIQPRQRPRSQSRTAGIVAGASRSCVGERRDRVRRVAEDDVLLRRRSR